VSGEGKRKKGGQGWREVNSSDMTDLLEMGERKEGGGDEAEERGVSVGQRFLTFVVT